MKGGRLWAFIDLDLLVAVVTGLGPSDLAVLHRSTT